MSLFNKKKKPEKISESDLMELVQQTVQADPLLKYCGFFKDKQRNSLALFTKLSDHEIEIKLIDLYGEHSILSAAISGSSAKLNKISVSSENQGYGGLLMKEFIYRCKECGITHIYGNFFGLNSKCAEKLGHFFQKFEFEISFSQKNTEAAIQRNL